MKTTEDGEIRIENSNEDRRAPSCCFCLDVRIGAILIGLMYLIVYSAIMVGKKSKALVEEEKNDQDWKYYVDMHEVIAQRHNVDQKLVGMIIASLIFVLVVLMIYGAALRRSNFIVPFFCWQVFEMCRSVLIAATTVNQAARVKFIMEMQTGDDKLINMSLPRFRMILITVWLIVLTIMLYLMTVIWVCFKHCKSVEDRQERLEANPSYFAYHTADMDAENLLPSYDDVLKANPPPAYTQ